MEVGGTLYGMTGSGGRTSTGTLFSVDPTTGTERVLYTFTGRSDGAFPRGDLNVGGVLYGTTTEGGLFHGTWSYGTVFAYDIAAGKYTVVHDFNGNDGMFPIAGLIQVGENLYGTTQEGGRFGHCPYGCGTVFAISPTTQLLTTLHQFKSGLGGTDPAADMIKVGHRLYGTAQDGKGFHAGSIFSVNLRTGHEKTVHEFYGIEGPVQPYGGLLNVDGVLYGASDHGGGYDCDNGGRGCGTIYTVDPKTGAINVVYVFTGFSDGAWPRSSLINVGGILYGTTSFGGSCADNPYAGCGTVFAFDPKSGTKTTIYTFQGGKDGARPRGTLLNVSGVLYGTTEEGGGSANCYPGCGTVFAITP